jgi:hypothetical protein
MTPDYRLLPRQLRGSSSIVNPVFNILFGTFFLKLPLLPQNWFALLHSPCLTIGSSLLKK